MQLLNVVDVNIVQFAAAIALRVMMLGHIGVEPGRATCGLHHLQFPHRRQVVDCLVNGAQRDARHQLAGCREESLGTATTVLAPVANLQLVQIRRTADE